jgi:DNA invertase Pin-like site-specific DNA recombinase
MVSSLQQAVRPAPIRAAEYVRMSTEHQKYSTANQSDTIHAYAALRNTTIVRTYADEGISGLTFERRDALKRLIADVQGGTTDFKAILVYDVSRWGRFQDTDESAHYEFICRRAGIGVHYCAEQFDNDGSPISAFIKNIKRWMAGEYSRELSAKTFTAQCRIVQLGFRIGGQPGYGLRRMLVSGKGIPRRILKFHEWKAVTTDRIILVPGPASEVRVVRWIYATFVRKHKTEAEIAALLSRRGSKNHHGRPWGRKLIKRILRNELYIGNNIWGRTSCKLKTERVINSPEKWLRADGAFEPIVDRSLFEAAQAIFRDRVEHPITGKHPLYSKEEMLRRLRRLLKRHGYLSSKLINESRGIVATSSFETRFGSLTRAYQLIGYVQKNDRPRKRRRHRRFHLSDDEMLEKLKGLLRERGHLTQVIIDETVTVPCSTCYIERFGSMNRVYELIAFKPDPWGSSSSRPRGLSDNEMLDVLRNLVREHGAVTKTMIQQRQDVPSCRAYEVRFGGLRKAYRLIGYTPRPVHW